MNAKQLLECQTPGCGTLWNDRVYSRCPSCHPDAPAPGASPEETPQEIGERIAYSGKYHGFGGTRMHVNRVQLAALIASALHSAVDAERERIAGELREEAQQYQGSSTDFSLGAVALTTFADRLAPRASAGEREGEG